MNLEPPTLPALRLPAPRTAWLTGWRAQAYELGTRLCWLAVCVAALAATLFWCDAQEPGWAFVGGASVVLTLALVLRALPAPPCTMRVMSGHGWAGCRERAGHQGPHR